MTPLECLPSSRLEDHDDPNDNDDDGAPKRMHKPPYQTPAKFYQVVQKIPPFLRTFTLHLRLSNDRSSLLALILELLAVLLQLRGSTVLNARSMSPLSTSLPMLCANLNLLPRRTCITDLGPNLQKLGQMSHKH